MRIGANKLALRPASDRASRKIENIGNGSSTIVSRKWHSALLGMSVLLAIVFLAWFARACSNYSSARAVLLAESSRNEKSPDWREQKAIDADLYFDWRAHATEDGFIAALPLHKRTTSR